MTDQHEDAAESLPSSQVAAALVANHREFLTFVERRVGNRDVAEEILGRGYCTNRSTSASSRSLR